MAGWMKTPLGTEVDIGAGHIVLDGFPALRERGTAPSPLLSPCLLWPWSPISDTAELSFDIGQWKYTVHFNSPGGNTTYAYIPINECPGLLLLFYNFYSP